VALLGNGQGRLVVMGPLAGMPGPGALGALAGGAGRLAAMAGPLAVVRAALAAGGGAGMAGRLAGVSGPLAAGPRRASRAASRVVCASAAPPQHRATKVAEAIQRVAKMGDMACSWSARRAPRSFVGK
jgi:hypothetical protein